MYAEINHAALRWHMSLQAPKAHVPEYRCVLLTAGGSLVTTDGYHLGISRGAVEWVGGVPKDVAITGLPTRLKAPPARGAVPVVMGNGLMRTGDNQLLAATVEENYSLEWQQLIPGPDTPVPALTYAAIDAQAVADGLRLMPGKDDLPLMRYYGAMAAYTTADSKHSYYRALISAPEGDDYDGDY